jgi:hypothetical protein
MSARGVLLALLALGFTVSHEAAAEDEPAAPAPKAGKDAIILPTQLGPRGHVPVSLARKKVLLDNLLTDTAQDLGLVVDVTEEVEPEQIGEHLLVGLADERKKLVFLPMLTALDDEGTELELRIVAASPDARVLKSRVQRLGPDEVAVRAAVMLRDLATAPAEPAPAPRPKTKKEELAAPAHSKGRAILATNGTVWGAFLGYSIQRASQSDDPRLLYPMVGVGAGIGLGASIIVADEWDVGVGDAWYLAAGAWWPAVAGHLVYIGRFADKPNATGDEGWSFGLVGTVTGVTLSTVGLLSSGMGDGGAALAHSGGATGLVVGGLVEMAITGESEVVPFTGMGYGAAIGWLVAASTAVYFRPDPARVLAVDLGLLLGGLAGASAASPLLIDSPTHEKVGGWVAATGGGLIAGGILAGWLSRPADPVPESTARLVRLVLPAPSIVGQPGGPGEIAAPGPGVTWQGDW